MNLNSCANTTIVLAKNQASLLRDLINNLSEDIRYGQNDKLYTEECLKKLNDCYLSLLKINESLIK